MDPVSWYLEIYKPYKSERIGYRFYLFRILLTHPWLTRSCLLITQGRIPAAAISIIFSLMWFGRGRPLMNTPPSWFTLPCPENKHIHKPGIWQIFIPSQDCSAYKEQKVKALGLKATREKSAPINIPRSIWHDGPKIVTTLLWLLAAGRWPRCRQALTLYGGHMRTLGAVNTEVLEVADKNKNMRTMKIIAAVAYGVQDTSISGHK